LEISAMGKFLKMHSEGARRDALRLSM
jgi:hypothetical protein